MGLFLIKYKTECELSELTKTIKDIEKKGWSVWSVETLNAGTPKVCYLVTYIKQS